MFYAAKCGSLEVLKYLHDNGYLHQSGCPWDKDACYYAAENGHLSVLKYLHQNGCPWDKQACLRIAEKNCKLEIVEC